MQASVLFIIPARAGSKGVPGKNYKMIQGKPLVWWSIEAARAFGHNSEIVVSTNDSIIMDIAESFNREYGSNTVRIIERPDDISGDFSITEEAMSHAVDEIKKIGITFKYISLLQPTSPARPNNLIERCYNKIVKNGSSSLLTVSSHTPFFWQYKNDQTVKCYETRKMRQHMNKYDMYYHDDGNIYIIEEEKFDGTCRITEHPLLYECSKFESMQIDTYEDFNIMEIMARYHGGLLARTI